MESELASVTPLADHRRRRCLIVQPFFRWYDLWIGAYVDVEDRTLYVCPLPMIGVKVMLRCV